MKRIMMGFVVLALLIGNYAYATTYTYTGQNFYEAYSPYTTSMNITGTIVTSSPIPPNSVDFDITPILTSWSFNDGVNTIDSSNGKFPPSFPPIFSTNARGNIIEYSWAVANMGLAPVVGDELEFILVTMSGDSGFADIHCAFVIGDVCTVLAFSIAETNFYGVANPPGTWVSDRASTPTSVPTLPQWSLILLLLGMVGVAFGKRRVSPCRQRH